MMRRIDLPGAGHGSLDYRAAVPRAEFDVEAALHVVRPICDAVRTRGVEAILEMSTSASTACVHDDIAVPPEALQDALERARPGRAGRLWRSRSAGCARPARPSARPTP